MSSWCIITDCGVLGMTSETGLQLFGRLVARPSLAGLEDTLFPGGPGPKEVVEVGGDPGCGKTLLLTQMVARCVLPHIWEGIETGGLATGVVLLDTDHHFQMYKLISMMESRMAGCGFTVTQLEEIVKDSLGRLTVYEVADSRQLVATLFSAQTVVSTRTDIGLVLLDSVCAFYWHDAMTAGTKKMDVYAKNTLKTVQKALGDFKGVIVYTRPSYFHTKASKSDSWVSADTGPGCVNRRVYLKPTGDNNYCATVTTPTIRFDKSYRIDCSGFIWDG